MSPGPAFFGQTTDLQKLNQFKNLIIFRAINVISKLVISEVFITTVVVVSFIIIDAHLTKF